jgi:hypothetical protein
MWFSAEKVFSPFDACMHAAFFLWKHFFLNATKRKSALHQDGFIT